jgi:hypothetical protein
MSLTLIQALNQKSNLKQALTQNRLPIDLPTICGKNQSQKANKKQN